MDADRRMQRRRRAPRAKAYARHVLARDARGGERQRTSIARDPMARAGHPRDLDLQTFDRRVDVPRGAGTTDLFAQHMPRLDRLPHLDRDAVVGDGAEARKAELDERVEPASVHRVAEGIELGDDVADIRRDEMRQQPAIVQRRAPAHESPRIRLLPEPGHERAQQQRLDEAHPRMRRHLEGPKLEQAEASGRGIRRVELVDRELRPVRVAGEVGEQMPEQTIDEPRRHRRLSGLFLAAHLLEGDLELVETVVARFVDSRRLARRADERPREQVGERRMILPIRDETLEQVRAAQQRTVGSRGSAQRHVIAAAGAGVPAILHELLGRQPCFARLGVQRLGDVDELVPRCRGMHVDFDHAGVGGDVEHPDARIARRRVALDHDRLPLLRRRRLDARQQLHVVFEPRERRHEHMQVPVAHFDAQCRLDHVLGRHRFEPGRARRPALGERRRGRKVPAWSKGIDRGFLLDVFGQHIGQRRERQPESERRIAGKKVESFAPDRPRTAAPGLPRFAIRARRTQRKHESGRSIESLQQQPGKPCALVRLREIGGERVRIRRKRCFAGE